MEIISGILYAASGRSRAQFGLVSPARATTKGIVFDTIAQSAEWCDLQSFQALVERTQAQNNERKRTSHISETDVFWKTLCGGIVGFCDSKGYEYHRTVKTDRAAYDE
jgi:hypothetical protein